MDLSLCQLRPRYGEALAEYHRLYEHKTRILRDSGDYPQLLATCRTSTGGCVRWERC